MFGLWSNEEGWYSVGAEAVFATSSRGHALAQARLIKRNPAPPRPLETPKKAYVSTWPGGWWINTYDGGGPLSTKGWAFRPNKIFIAKIGRNGQAIAKRLP